jgi:hypothetical protein
LWNKEEAKGKSGLDKINSAGQGQAKYGLEGASASGRAVLKVETG